MIAALVASGAVDAAHIGRPGEWIGPMLVAGLAGGLDYSAAGPARLRDRVAVIGYYAAAVSFAAILGWTGYIRGEVHSYSWVMAWAVASLVTHAALLLAMFGELFGWFRAVSKKIGKAVGFASGDSTAAKINGKLLGWTLAAAITAPMSGTGGWGHLVDQIVSGTTGAWSGIVTVVQHWLGG